MVASETLLYDATTCPTFIKKSRIDLFATPPFLFRAACSDVSNERASRGLNTNDEIDPLYGYDAHYHADLASIPYVKAKKMIREHLNYEYKTPSEFSSWSVSILFVILHAMRKAVDLGEKDVLIYMMDTSKIRASRIHSAADLISEERYNLRCEQYRQTQVYLYKFTHGEYLIHGKLENSNGLLWQTVDIETLLKAGLEEAFPLLMIPENRQFIQKRLWLVRSSHFGDDTINRKWEIKGSLENIKRIARCFGEPWEGTMLLALMSDRRRDLSPEGIATIVKELGSMRLPTLPWLSSKALRKVHFGWYEVDEAQQFMQLLRILDDKAADYGDDSDTDVEA